MTKHLIMADTMNKAMLEKNFQTLVIDIGHQYGWKIAHFGQSQSARGRHITATMADGAGYFDLTMAKGYKLVFAELKREKGTLSPRQKDWVSTMKEVAKYNPHVEVYIWYPHDISDIINILSKE